MRFVHFYLIAYFLLVGGAAVALWEAGVLARIAPMWLAASALCVIGLGLLVIVTSVRPTRT